MHRSGTQHFLLVGAVWAFCALAVGACGAPDEEAKPRPLPDEPRELEPGTYRTEEFEPPFSFEVGEGWSTALPEAYDLLLITRGDEGGLGDDVQDLLRQFPRPAISTPSSIVLTISYTSSLRWKGVNRQREGGEMPVHAG